MTFSILEKSQSENGDPPSINIFKLKLCLPVSNLTYIAGFHMTSLNFKLQNY